MTEAEFFVGMKILKMATGRDVPLDQAKVWYTLFSDLTAEQFQAGIVETLRTNTFAGLPPIGLIRQNAIGKQPAEQDRSLLAWDRVLEAIREHGGYQTVRFDDPAIHAAVRSCGGWVALCEQSTEQMVTWTKKAFCDAYRAHVASGLLTAAAAARLPGIIATDRARDGYDEPAQVEIETHLSPAKIKVVEKPGPARVIAFKPEYHKIGRPVSFPLSEEDEVEEQKKMPMTLKEQKEKVEAAKKALLQKYQN